MRTLNRNKSPFWYLLYDSKVPAKDEYGNETGEELVVYKPAVAMNANTFPGRNAVRVSTGKTQLSGISAISFRSSQKPIVNFKTEPSSTVVFTLSPSWSEGRSGISDQSISRNERFKSVCVTTAWFPSIRPVSSMTTQPA